MSRSTPSVWPVVRDAVAGAPPRVRRIVGGALVGWVALIVLQALDSSNAPGAAGLAEFLSAAFGATGGLLLVMAALLERRARAGRAPTTDTEALRRVLRQDPDVILIGELRDPESISTALTAAETGHLVFATLHTNSAVSTINRIVDVFPPYQQAQVRAQLSFVLEGVLCQALIPRGNGPGRVMALEVMVPNPAIRNLIREDKVHQMYSQMQIGQDKFGMQTMNQSLASLYLSRQITLETALSASSLKEELQEMIQRGTGVVPGAGLNRSVAPGVPVRR